MKKHLVQEGETLWTVSKLYFKTNDKWRKIYSYNAEIIGNKPDMLSQGMILTIPKWKTLVKCLKNEADVLESQINHGAMDQLNHWFRVRKEIEDAQINILTKFFIVFFIAWVTFSLWYHFIFLVK